jgi:hypothetical protein
MKSEYFKVEVLSPVHIGTGDKVDPFHYLIDDQKNCHFVDFGTWIADHPDPDELLKQFSSGNIAQMRSYLAEKVEPALYAERSCRVVSDMVIHESHKHLGDPRSKNQLLLDPNLVGGGGGPLLPGSSLKGAIRTAVLDWLDRSQGLRLKDCRTSKEQNEKLKPFLGDITRNSFQALKIADCEAVRNSSLIVEAREVRRNPEKDTTPKSSCEVLSSRLLGDADQAVMTTRIALGRAGEKEPVLTLKNKETLDWLQLCQLVNNYSRTRYLKEQQKFWNLSHFARTKEAMLGIEDSILNPPPGGMVFKVGHYSQIEYVTLEKNKPQTRKSKGKNLPHGTTRTLADGIYPFGWVLITPCSEDVYQQLCAQRELRNNELRVKQDQLREARLALTREKREVLRKQREELQRQKREREERAREEAAKPWLAIIRHLVAVDDWGSLKQLLEKEGVKEYQTQAELAAAVLDAANRARDKRPDKWDSGRTEEVNAWLEPSGLQLIEIIDIEGGTLPEDCAMIDTLKNFGDYQAASIDLEKLSPQAIKMLQEKMKEWGCDKKKAKKNKQQAYRAVYDCLKK